MQLNLPNEIQDVCDQLISSGFELVLVGGAIREILDGRTPKDFDFELRNHSIDEAKWASYLKDFFTQKFDDVEQLKFGIYRVKTQNFVLEFSSPRTESFRDGDHSHSNFDATLSNKLSYEESFQRRDFTIGAMGIRINDGEFIDPFSGRDHWKQKILHPVSEDCFKDPVRLLRAIRFRLQLGLRFSDDFQQNLWRFNLQKVSDYYFWYEAKKSNNILLFYQHYHQILNDHNIESRFNISKEIPKKSLILKDHSDRYDLAVEALHAYPECISKDHEIQFFQLKQNEVNNLRNILTAIGQLNENAVFEMKKLEFKDLTQSHKSALNSLYFLAKYNHSDKLLSRLTDQKQSNFLKNLLPKVSKNRHHELKKNLSKEVQHLVFCHDALRSS